LFPSIAKAADDEKRRRADIAKAADEKRRIADLGNQLKRQNRTIKDPSGTTIKVEHKTEPPLVV
jgi:hypothetical protein